MDDLGTLLLVGMILGLVVAAARRSARVPVGGQTWDNEKVTLFAGGLYQRGNPAEPTVGQIQHAAIQMGLLAPRSYIIPVTCARYDGHDGHCWYACGTIDQIISHLHLNHYAKQEDDGA